MADGEREGGRNGPRTRQNGNDDDEDDGNDAASPPDIGLGTPNAQNQPRDSRECSIAPGTSDGRREDNPFSFRHFLSEGGGARPKAYVPSPYQVSPSPRLQEVTGLPDFVQDHLVMEQCYLSSAQPSLPVDLDSLPHYAGHDGYPRQVPEALPDFLSDGPIRSERRESDSPPNSPSAPDHRHSPRYQIENDRLRLENERLRRELETMRRQLSDQITRSETLEAELGVARSREDGETLGRVIQQAEDDLKRATKRAVTAETRAEKLKQEIDSLRAEVESLRAREGPSTSSAENERLASQLRSAANTAEFSLRQLLLGVDNLRSMAASISRSAGGSGSSKPPPHDSDDDSLGDDNAWGPAL